MAKILLNFCIFNKKKINTSLIQNLPFYLHFPAMITACHLFHPACVRTNVKKIIYPLIVIVNCYYYIPGQTVYE